MKKSLLLCAGLALLVGCETSQRVGSAKEASRAVYNTKGSAANLVEPGVVSSEDVQKDKAPDRELSYRGEAALVTDDIPATSKSIREDCKAIGGYLFSMGSARLDLRIPSKHLENFIAGLSKYGKVKASTIQAEDVTDKNFDLRVRISNAEKMRQRLLDLSSKTKDIKEALKIEQELARVTAELERMKGMLNRSTEQVKYSKLLVHLSSTEPTYSRPVRVPFSWVNNLAKNLKNPYTPAPNEGNWFTRKIESNVPDGFATFYNRYDNFWAMNGRGGFYHIQRVDNKVSNAGVEFWKQTVMKYLKDGKLMTDLQAKNVKSKSGEGFQISAGYGAGKNRFTYVLQVIPGEDKILVSELWGVVGDVSANTELLQEILKSAESSL